MAGSDAVKAEQNLALKVMRLTRPSLAAASATCPFTPAAASNDSLESLLMGAWGDNGTQRQESQQPLLSSSLVLPQSFGNIYLGETFVSYVCLHNDSTEACDNLSLMCHLQTVTQRLPLLQTPPASTTTSETTASSSSSSSRIEPGQSIDHVLSHEVKELGTHILVCEVNYTAPSAGKMNFRKYFKFQVMKPLDVKTKFYNAENDDVFLEAQVQNVTNWPLCLEKVGLEPSPMFKVTSLNSVASDESSSGPQGQGQAPAPLVFGKVNFLKPQDSRQYLFSLSPRGRSSADLRLSYKQLKGATNIGKLDIIWRSNFGERGRLQTSQLQRLAPNHGDLRFNVESVPSVVLLGKAFKINCCIFNNSERTLDLELTLENGVGGSEAGKTWPPHQPSGSSGAGSPGMLWSGVCSRKLGLIEPAGSTELELEVVAQATALQPLSGVRITDTLLMRSYQFDELCFVYVAKDESLQLCL